MIGSELQKSIFAALNGHSPPIAGGRIYDQVPNEEERIEETDAAYPYITIGDEQDLDNSNSCGKGYEVFIDVHIWSRPATTSKIELKDLGAMVKDILDTELTVAGFRTIVGQFQSARSARDVDGLTEHGILTFRFLLDKSGG